MRLAGAMLALFLIFSTFLNAQEDGNDTPLGDVARSFRKKPPSQEVIDNDNLPQVMEQVQSRRIASSALQYSIDGSGKNFQVSAPDATCSLSFSASARALLSRQNAQLDLPANQLTKLDGPATIDGDSFQVAVFNGTDWHLSEVAVALTLLKRTVGNDTADDSRATKPDSAMDRSRARDLENSAQKRSDAIFLYRMRAAAPPSAVTVFHALLNTQIGPDQEWHWAIVQARGYPPERAHDFASPAMQRPTGEPFPTQNLPQTSAQNQAN